MASLKAVMAAWVPALRAPVAPVVCPVLCRAGHPPGLPTPSSPPRCLSSVTGDRSAVTTSSESHSRLQE